jgi:gliding motility-associated-like protein
MNKINMKGMDLNALSYIEKFFIFFLSIIFNTSFAQVDTQFWFAAPDISQSHGDSPIQIVISAYDFPADITISQPANPNFLPIQFLVPKFSSYSYNLTSLKTLIETSGVDNIKNTGLLVTSSSLVTGYYLVDNFFNPDIFSFKGTNSLGTDFIVLSQKHLVSTRNDGYNAAYIVATEDNTKISIFPSVDLVGHKNNIPFEIKLNKGEVYVAAALNPFREGNQIGGTFVTSDKAIAITISDDSVLFPGKGCQDLNGDQLIPVCLAGNEYVTMPGSLDVSIGGNTNVTDIIYIYPTQDNTQITVNGNLFPQKKNKGEFFQIFNTGKSNYIFSDKPVLLYQLGGNGCESGGAVIPQVSRSGLDFSSATRLTDENFFINLLTKKDYMADFEISGITGNYTINWTNLENDWVAGRINLSNPQLVRSNTTIYFKNSSGNFNLGWINGGPSSGTRYGYFSNFSISLAESEVLITSVDDKAVFSLKNPQGDNGFFQVSFDSGQTWSDVTQNSDDFDLSGPSNSVLTVKNNALVNGLLVRYVELSGSCSITSSIARLTISFPAVIAIDDSVSTEINIPVFGNVLENDFEKDGGKLLVLNFYINGIPYVAGDTVNIEGIGVFTLNEDGLFYFEPNDQYVGELPNIIYEITNNDEEKDWGTLFIKVTGNPDDFFLIMPNVFTPNGDSVNDYFFPKFINIVSLELWIFNKWGETIFYTNLPESLGWNGRLGDTEAPPGNYVYKLIYGTSDNKKRNQTGVFLLLK